MIDRQLAVKSDGRLWRLYSFEWKGADGTFSSTFYAISDEHALLVMEEIKESAKLVGRVEGIIPT